MTYSFRFILFLFIIVSACTPKVVEPTVETTKPEPEVKEVDPNLSPCRKFSDNVNSEQLLESYVLMHDYVKAKDFNTAFTFWKDVYAQAPAADGKRNTVFSDGIKIMEHFYNEETDPVKKEEHISKIFEIYDEMDKCYSKDGYVPGKKAFDLYYKFKDRSTNAEIYDLFSESLKKDGDDAYFFIINPFTALLIDRLYKNEISLEEGQTKFAQLKRIIDKGKKSGKNQEQWGIIDEYTSSRFGDLEGVKGFYDCQYFKDAYYSLFTAEPTNCEVIIDVYGRLKWGGCDKSDPMLVELDRAYNTHCREAVVTQGPQCSDLLRNGEYREAIQCYEEKMNNSTDPMKQSQYAFIISKIYYGHLKNFPQSRKYALKAAGYRPNWGDPFILIGKLYASSGPLCGPGRGFDSQVVTWVAIDKWNHAKRIDSSVTAEANKLINKYAKFMPNKEDIFIRGMNEGDTYRVGCWIQENTKVRVAK